MGIDTYTDMEARERLEAQQDAQDGSTFFCESCGRRLPWAEMSSYLGDDCDLCRHCLADLRQEGWR